MNITDGDIELGIRDYDDIMAIADEHHNGATDRCQAMCRALELDHDAFHEFINAVLLKYMAGANPIVIMLGQKHIYALTEYVFQLGILIGKEHST